MNHRTDLLRSPGGATWSVLGVGGAPSGFFFFGGAAAWSGLYSWCKQCEQSHDSKLDGSWKFDLSVCFCSKGLKSHLKCRPVHGHPWAMVVAKPLQVLLCVCSQNGALQFSVYCGITKERKMGQMESMKGTAGTRDCCQNDLAPLKFLHKLKSINA